jgi:replication factor C subunit 3/5
MLLREKYIPNSIEEFGEKYTYLNNIENIPHTIIYGKNGCGKTTLMQLILKNRYGANKIKLSKDLKEFKMNNNKIIELSIFYSSVHYIINPCLYGLYDKVILLNFLKDISSNTDIKKFINIKNATKIIIIKNAENLSKNAQNALRSIMENNNNDFKLVFLCSSLNKIIEPLISRCMLVKVDNNVQKNYNILKNISIKENININDETINKIIEYSSFNLKKSINYLEYYNTTHKKENEYLKLDDSNIFIQKLVNYIYTKNLSNIIEMRKIIYNLFISFNKPLYILNEIYLIIEKDINNLDNIDDNYKNSLLLEINDYIIELSSMLSVANKPIIYFENFIYFIFELLNKHNIDFI